MIFKSLSRKSNPQQLIRYALRYIVDDKEKTQDKATLILKKNLRSHSVEGYIREFQKNETFRIYKRKDSVVIYHDIISFAPSDKEKISLTILKNIAKEYITLRGENNLYLIAQHSDKNHEHIHCIVSGVKINGYSSRISKQQFKSLKLQLENYQHTKYPELDKSLIRHEKSNKKSKEEIIQLVKNIRQTDKQKVQSFIKNQYEQAASKEDFLTRLHTNAYNLYWRNGKEQGILFEGRKFRFSKLGYDEEKFEELNKKNSLEEEQLKELESIRGGRAKQQTKEIKPIEKDKQILKSDEEKELIELQSLRDKHKQKEKGIEITIQENNSAETVKSDSDYDPNLYTEDGMPLFSPFAYVKPNLFIERDEE